MLLYFEKSNPDELKCFTRISTGKGIALEPCDGSNAQNIYLEETGMDLDVGVIAYPLIGVPAEESTPRNIKHVVHVDENGDKFCYENLYYVVDPVTSNKTHGLWKPLNDGNQCLSHRFFTRPIPDLEAYHSSEISYQNSPVTVERVFDQFGQCITVNNIPDDNYAFFRWGSCQGTYGKDDAFVKLNQPISNNPIVETSQPVLNESAESEAKKDDNFKIHVIISVVVFVFIMLLIVS